MQTLNYDCQVLQIFPQNVDADQSEPHSQFDCLGGREREDRSGIGGRSRHGQIVESTDSRPARYYLNRITDAGSVTATYCH